MLFFKEPRCCQLAYFSLFHVSETEGTGFTEILVHILQAKVEKKLHDSAMNKTNTMYDIEFPYFNFITNGSQQGDLYFSFQLTADGN